MTQQDDIFESIFAKKRGRRVLICTRGKCAAPELGLALEPKLLALIQEHGLDDPNHAQHVTCRTVQCLGVCHSGPIVTVHPEAIRYKCVDEQALKRIFHKHLLQDIPVEELMLPPLTSA